MIPITLTCVGKVIGKAELFDCGDDIVWSIIHIAFASDGLRTITRTNDEWRVDLENDDGR